MYKEAANINFTSASTRKRQLDQALSGNAVTANAKRKPAAVAPPSNDDLTDFYNAISFGNSGVKPAILSVVPDYLNSYKAPEHIPLPLAALYNASQATANYKELVDYCDTLNISVSMEQCKFIEENTKCQSSDKLWHRVRMGRVTASVMHEVFHTNPAQPSISLINKICHPQKKRIQTAAMKHGIVHEKDGLLAYKDAMKKQHSDFQLSQCGVFLSQEEPFLAATPDGMASCSCCGQGCVEVKCPDSQDIKIYCERKDSCFDGEMNVKDRHHFYTQAQMQMHMTKTNYCDLVLWTKNGHIIRRVKHNAVYVKELVGSAEHFFKIAILPELVGKFFSRGPVTCTGATNKYCYCEKGEEEGREMVGCDNDQCTRQWFHFVCVGLKNPPKSKTWFCPDCRILDKCRPQKKHLKK